MTVKTNAKGAKRKQLANDIGNWLGCEVSYCGAPSFAYQVGSVLIDKDGTLEFPTLTDSLVVERLLSFLEDNGYEIDYSLPEVPTEEPQEAPQEEASEETCHRGYSIVMPASDFDANTMLNLQNIINAKAPLFKKAFGVDELPVNLVGNKYDFPWFPQDSSLEELTAYFHFITALCDMAKKQKRVTAKEKPIDNEKYAFRCFLLRLGFIGDEFKKERKILLRNLEGSSAFKSGAKKEVTE